MSEIKSNSKRDYLIINDLCPISVQNELRWSINVSFLPLWLSSEKSYFEPFHRLSGVFSSLINENKPCNWTPSKLIFLWGYRNWLDLFTLVLLSNQSSSVHVSLKWPLVRWAGHLMRFHGDLLHLSRGMYLHNFSLFDFSLAFIHSYLWNERYSWGQDNKDIEPEVHILCFLVREWGRIFNTDIFHPLTYDHVVIRNDNLLVLWSHVHFKTILYKILRWLNVTW